VAREHAARDLEKRPTPVERPPLRTHGRCAD
jgi:hypothetical protein